MSNGRKLTYPLIFGLLTLGWQAWGVEPIDHQPLDELIAALKSDGHERIAQGVKSVISKDATTGELFTARAPLMLTLNKQTGAWTISVFHDKVSGSTLLIGNSLRRVGPGDGLTLPTFDRQKANAAISKLNGLGPAYYPDEIRRYANDGFQRAFSGQIDITTHPAFRQAMNPVFADVIVRRSDGEFVVLVVDEYGACAKIAFGGTFSEKS